MSLSSWQLGEKGVYKAINELDILLPWIQAYIQTIVWGTRRWLKTRHLYIKNRSLPKRPDKQPCAGCTTCLAAALQHWRRALVKKRAERGTFKIFQSCLGSYSYPQYKSSPLNSYSMTRFASCPPVCCLTGTPGHTAWAHLVVYYHKDQDLAMPCVTTVWLQFKITWNTSEPPLTIYM